MKASILSQTDWLVFPLITVVLFTIIFAGVVFWVLRPGARAVYAERSRLVFEEGGRDGA